MTIQKSENRNLLGTGHRGTQARKAVLDCSRRADNRNLHSCTVLVDAAAGHSERYTKADPPAGGHRLLYCYLGGSWFLLLFLAIRIWAFD